ncbi:MAG: wax ester/triacylglycerol synthase family O-acyltransferase [Actinomycetota bacterium]|nr:wax ester/triacylglycerol synthase family O-acyltransferase [Actinomycetota bacterium]
MTDRLAPLDVSFLYLEEPTTPMHVGGVAVFRPPSGEPFDYDRLVGIIEDRIGLVPRYRQKIKWVPGHIASPVWVDDGSFDLGYHIRRSALPKPGTDDQLRELVGRLMSRRLDRTRPLWEMYFVEGLSDGRIAVITKSHHAMVDGISSVDISQVLLDLTPEPREVPQDDWAAEPEPNPIDLVVEAISDFIRQPTEVFDAIRNGVNDATATAVKVAGQLSGVLAYARTAARPASETPLNVDIGEQRRFGMARTELDDYKRVRKSHGGTVNDVVLATVAGALRNWLMTRGEPVNDSTVIRAMVPVSVRAPTEMGALGNKVSSYLVDLPVGEEDPVERLHQISTRMKKHKEAGQSVGADALVRLSGFAPPTLHSMGARAASGLSKRLFNVVVTNVPGPQFPLYAGGAPMIEVFPVVPLAKNQAVSIGLTSYNGGVYYGLNADRDAMTDIDTLCQLIEESLAELVETVT